MNDLEQKRTIESAIRAFASETLYEAGMGLLDALGYRSDLTLRVSRLKAFRNTLDQSGRLKNKAAKTTEWKNIEFLLQITGDNLSVTDQSAIQFQKEYQPTEIQSYVFLAIELKKDRYTRTELSQITRAVNRVFDMPAMLLFKYGENLSLAIIKRRLHKRDEARDVLEKVTLIKDITYADPLRAHIEILFDLSLTALYDEFYFHNFAGLHQAWEKRLASYALNERFYREIANWYFWALTSKDVTLPRSIESIRNKEERGKQRSTFFIRLLTRLIFCWFLQEKRLLPRDLFRYRTADELLTDVSPKVGTYYKACLQNLFFATLNREQDQRGWRKKYKGSRDGSRGVTNLWRYQDLFTSAEKMECLLRDHIPFINGGLFDCLDDVRDDKSKANARLDDFSEERNNRLCLPNELFFGEERQVDLSAIYDDKRRKKEKVCGLIEILNRYKFTVEENTPLEEEIALDPELLGKVFENLLASFNEDTRTTARKALGAFYTPREIVGYMVDESLRNYLSTQVPSVPEASLRALFAPQEETPNLTEQQQTALVNAIGRIKILDPACGSGAFPMGALHRLVELLQKLDPNNESWKRDRLAEAERYYEMLRQANAPKAELEQCEARIEDIRRSFDTRYHALDFARKLYLIENCIYGVDILPIACQIAKLRFFIALIVDQNVDPKAPNLGVRPLPNLETKIVAADTLIPIERPDGQMDLLDQLIRPIRRELKQVRHDHFNARTPRTKAKCRERDAELRQQISDLLRQNGLPADSAKALAVWDPYNQNQAATFFDPEWMFGSNEAQEQANPAATGESEKGFDIVLGNPPYVRIQTLKRQNPKLVAFYKEHYQSAKKGNYDLYVVFVEAGLNFMKQDGHLAYILPHKFFNAQYGQSLRELLANGQHLQHIVHFGDQQVFPGATNYVCLLFLAKAGTDTCRFVRADDLATWLQTFKGTEGSFPIKAVTAEEWNFAVGPGADIFNRLKTIQMKLEDVTTRIFQGIKTSADKVYVVEEVARTKKAIRIFSEQTGEEHELESDLLHRLIKGGDSKAFHLATTNRLILFPYVRSENDKRVLIPASTLKKRYPLTWVYLKTNQRYLEQREDGRMKHEGWYGYIYPKALDVMPLPKLFTPDIAPTAAFSYDPTGSFFFTGGVAGGYGILPKLPVKADFLLGMLNSHVVDFFHHNVATQMQGGWFSYESRFIKNLPIAPATPEQEALVIEVVDYLLWLNKHFQENTESKDARDPLMLGYWEQILNGLVYELYFPEELHARGLHIFGLVAQANLPTLDSVPKSQRLSSLRAEFERLYDLGHPIRSALHDLQTVEEVRIIEGKK